MSDASRDGHATQLTRRGAGWDAALPPATTVSAEQLAGAVHAARMLVVLDDDPTGTQTVRDVPVLTAWQRDDLEWAMRQGGAGFFILTNTRSLSAADAASRLRQIVESCLDVADEFGVHLAFVSRGDSTLRGHFPLETDVIGDVLAQRGQPADGILLSPAYIEAGRITLDGVHWLRDGAGLLPAGESDFARDATFGYRSSRLADWVEEKSDGRMRADDVVEIPLQAVRDGVDAVQGALRPLHGGTVLVADAVTDDDLRVVAVACAHAEAEGVRLIYRAGPSFARARLGQVSHPPLSDEELASLVAGRSAAHGLIVVGSHVPLTTRQLARLQQSVTLEAVELDARAASDPADAEQHIRDLIERVSAALEHAPVVLATSRELLRGADPEGSLAIARDVSRALTRITAGVVQRTRPAYVVAKGGITSSDIATDALGIRRARVAGSMFPGIVSVWRSESEWGPAAGLAYVVFAGNVGDDESLASAVLRLEIAAAASVA